MDLVSQLLEIWMVVCIIMFSYHLICFIGLIIYWIFKAWTNEELDSPKANARREAHAEKYRQFIRTLVDRNP